MGVVRYIIGNDGFARGHHPPGKALTHFGFSALDGSPGLNSCRARLNRLSASAWISGAGSI